jgi:hypothetical protein
MTSAEFKIGQRVRLLIESHFWKGGAPGTIKSGSVGTFSDLFGGKAQVVFDTEPNYPLVVDNSVLESVPDSAAQTFEEFVFRYLGKDREKYGTYGLTFAHAAWEAGVASTERRRYRFAALTDSEGKELSYPGYRRMPIVAGEDVTFPAMTVDGIEAHAGFSYDETGQIWPVDEWVRTLNKGDTISISRPMMRDLPDEWRK